MNIITVRRVGTGTAFDAYRPDLPPDVDFTITTESSTLMTGTVSSDAIKRDDVQAAIARAAQ